MNKSAARYFHACNLLTYFSLLLGLCAIFTASTMRSWYAAGALIAMCALMDAFDGKFARLFRRSETLKNFGVQFDSLTDAMSFGLVPVVCLLELLSFSSIGERFIWCAAAFFYVVCAITRLGVYNLDQNDGNGFIGLPTTIAALVLSSAFLGKPSVLVSMIILISLGIAMVSPVSFPRPKIRGMVVLLTWITFLLVFHGSQFEAGANNVFSRS